MKKILAVILVLVMALGLCACGVSPKIEEQLKTDKWAYKSTTLGVTFIQVYEFLDDGEYVNTMLTENGSAVDSNGTYKIKSDKIVLLNEDGDEFVFNYQYTDDKLTLTSENGTQLYNVQG